jgi:hypothetical protein
MIGFFTDPYPDELLYSACARYHMRARNVSKQPTVRDLFGHHQAYVSIDFPTRLGYLVDQLPVETYSFNQLLDDNTMLPLYSPFMSPERHRQTRDDMRSNGGNAVPARLGVLTSILFVKHLRLCIVCAQDDKELWGEPYWHRVHQVPGVEVCPKHAVFLSDSNVRIRYRDKNQYFVTAKQAVAALSPSTAIARSLDLRYQEHKQLLTLANDALSLLTTRIELSDRAMLHRRYLRLLFERSLATYQGHVRHVALDTQFQKYYPSELLQRLDCELTGRCHWLRRILSDWKRSHSPHQHLLLMQFLECRPERFFRLSVQSEPYGKGPWPCLNVAGDHYMERRINECEIIHTQDHTKRLLGTFRCECGFSYRRTGADTTDDRRFKYDRIMSLGDVWYDKLREMVGAGDRSVPAMAQELGVPASTILVEIARIEKAGEVITALNPRFTRIRDKKPELTESELRERNRKRWLEVAAENPGAGRSALSAKARKPYEWLFEHDRQWLDDNYPRRQSLGPGIRTDWSKRDLAFSLAAREAAANIQHKEGRPIFASRTAIARRAGILTNVYKNHARLPLTEKALDEVAETHTSFAIRRLRWATKCFEEEQIQANKWQLITRAALSNKMAKRPQVKEAIDECVRWLAETNTLGWPSDSHSAGHVETKEGTAA